MGFFKCTTNKVLEIFEKGVCSCPWLEGVAARGWACRDSNTGICTFSDVYYASCGRHQASVGDGYH
jgi:hypothetical protein